jgi:hypothetical protein
MSEHIRLPEFKSGFTWRVLFALIIAAVLFLPISLYINLVAGATVAGAAVYLIILIFSGFSDYYGVNLTKQEVFLIYATVGGIAGLIPPYYWVIYRSYFIRSPLSHIFQLKGIPLCNLVPSWLAPPFDSTAYAFRTLLHPDFAASLLLVTIMSSLAFAGELMLAILFSKLFVEQELLEFPLARIDSSLITTLSKKPESEMRVFLLTLFAGVIIGAIIYLPNLLGLPVLVPLPFIDLTSFTEGMLPGAIIGIATDPAVFVTGFVLHPVVTACIFIGSLTVWILGNTALIQFWPQAFPKWTEEYYRGMTILPIYQRSQLRVWIGFQFGVTIGFSAVATLLMLPRLTRIFGSTRRDLGHGVYPRIEIIIVGFMACSLATVAIHHYLIPEYPLLLSLGMSLGFSFLASLLTAMGIGEAAITPGITFPWSIATYFSGYEGFSAWWFSPWISTGGNAGMVNAVKVAYLTETQPKDYFKALVIGYILSMSVGLIFMDFYWRVAPIPSAVYPNTMIFWPTWAMSDGLFATGQIDIKPTTIILGALTAALVAVFDRIFRVAGISMSGTGIVLGFFTLPTSALSMFLGSIIGYIVISRFMGRESWMRLRSVIVAGILAGVSISVGLGISLTMLAKAAWLWPW